MSEERCACGKYEAIPEIGGQLEDGIFHIATGKTPVCEVACLTREMDEVMEDRAMASLHAEEAAREVERLRAALEGVIDYMAKHSPDPCQECGLDRSPEWTRARAALEKKP